MAVGDVQDIAGRLRALLPRGWFGDPAQVGQAQGADLSFAAEDGTEILAESAAATTPSGTPILDALLAGFGDAWSRVYALIGYAKQQARIATASDVWIDGAAADFFAGRIVRADGETDDGFRARIKTEVLRERNTRAAMVQALTDLTGRAPYIFEPANPGDAGGYNLGGVGYGLAGGYGCLALPFQCFVTAYRPSNGGVASVNGYGGYLGGYGVGAIEYAALSQRTHVVTDDMIYAAVASVMPAGHIAWTRLGGLTEYDKLLPLGQFILGESRLA